MVETPRPPCPSRAREDSPSVRRRVGSQASVSGSAHPCVGSQELRECERLIIALGTDCAPVEEEFSTFPQAPPGQMVLPHAAALRVAGQITLTVSAQYLFSSSQRL